MDGNFPLRPEITERSPVRFTVKDLDLMNSVGLFEGQHKIELIDGVLFTMPGEGPLHMQLGSVWNKLLMMELLRLELAETYSLVSHGTLFIDDHNCLEPDLMVTELLDGETYTTGSGVKLAAEVAVTSRSYDLGEKPKLYAKCGVPELWVADAPGQALHIFAEPKDGQYGVTKILKGGTVSPRNLPNMEFKVADLLGE
jgi:Uma2 family endonuclease